LEQLLAFHVYADVFTTATIKRNDIMKLEIRLQKVLEEPMVYVMTNVSHAPFERGTGDAEDCNYLQVGLRELLEKVTGLESKRL
jgi:hypothetical protein